MWHTLPELEFKSNFPVDATTFKKSGKSRNPKPQKNTCMIVHGQRRAAACVPVVILCSSGHSGLSASGPPATSNFYYPRLFSRWSLAGEVSCWDVSASRIPWRTCILQRGVGCSHSQLRWDPAASLCVHQLSHRGGISRGKVALLVKPLPLYILWTVGVI